MRVKDLTIYQARNMVACGFAKYFVFSTYLPRLRHVYGVLEDGSLAHHLNGVVDRRVTLSGGKDNRRSWELSDEL